MKKMYRDSNVKTAASRTLYIEISSNSLQLHRHGRLGVMGPNIKSCFLSHNKQKRSIARPSPLIQAKTATRAKNHDGRSNWQRNTNQKSHSIPRS